ncbi:hypothetical protein EJK53_0506 [Moraxella catarrhalis]|uniref:Uncharacterized protein n=1 Tax=Moraxella catarrhalis TaxID=480 RepID=A0A3S9QE01_MORCA|nr:hypothetical protein EJK53_0506 [Moraxella catarrhalis]
MFLNVPAGQSSSDFWAIGEVIMNALFYGQNYLYYSKFFYF